MPNILIVDDKEYARFTVSEYLKLHEYEVETAENGDDALKKLETFEPDLILLDIMMPRMGGIAFIEELKKQNMLGNFEIMVF